MAYAFSKIDDEMNEDSSNIFQQNQNADGQDMMSQSNVKTSTAGDVGTQSAQSSGGSSKQKVTSQYNPEYKSDADVLRANVGKTNVASGGVRNLGEQIAQNKQELQDRSDAYMQNVKDANQYDVSESRLVSAVTGDDAAYKDLSSTLAKSQADYRPEFTGADDLRVKDVDLLGTQSGIQTLASRGRGPRYTAGMGAFDAALMQRDPEFQRLVAETRQDNRQLEQALGARPDELEAEAQTYADTALNTAQQTAEDFLTNYQQNLQSQNEAEQAAFADRIASLDRDKIQREALDKALANLMPELKQAAQGASLDRFLTTENVSDGNFVDYFDPSSLDYRDFLDASEADRFNRIAGLLGTGGSYAQGRMPGDSDMFRVNEEAMQSALFNDIMGARNRASIDQELKMRDILSGARDRSADANARLQQMLGTYDDDLTQLADEIMYRNEHLGAVRGQLPNFVADYGRPNIAAFQTDQMLTDDEARLLNEMSADIGRGQDYRAGNRSLQDSLIDRADFESYLVDRLTRANDDYLANLPPETAEVKTGGTINPPAPVSGNVVEDRMNQDIINAGGGGGGGKGDPSPFNKLVNAIRRAF